VTPQHHKASPPYFPHQPPCTGAVNDFAGLAAEPRPAEPLPRLRAFPGLGREFLNWPARAIGTYAVPSVLMLAAIVYLTVERSSRLGPRPAAGVVAACTAAAPMFTALAWARRRPATPLGTWLVVLGMSATLMSIGFFADPPSIFAGAFAAAVSIGVFVYLLGSYPAGRLRPWLVCAVLAAVVIMPAAPGPEARGIVYLGVAAGIAVLAMGVLTALVRKSVSAGRTLNRLLDVVSERPSIVSWQRELASVLDDPSATLELVDDREREVRSGGAATSDRLRIPIRRGAQPVAALCVDRRLAVEPELLRAVAVASSLAVELSRLDAELRMSLGRVAAAGDSERKRIARDLHDCTQQRLVTLRIHLSLAGDSIERPEDRAVLASLGCEVDQLLDELREVTHGMYPAVLGRYGVATALRSASARSTLPVRVEDAGILRHDEAIEHAIYFCCLEALQNVAKHAGPGASAVVRLDEAEDAVRFEVDDDGIGFRPDAVPLGHGLLNLADRLKAVGGSLSVESSPGQGTRVAGKVTVA
jgi:signal transduction histidine kinase